MKSGAHGNVYLAREAAATLEARWILRSMVEEDREMAGEEDITGESESAAGKDGVNTTEEARDTTGESEVAGNTTGESEAVGNTTGESDGGRDTTSDGIIIKGLMSHKKQ